MNKSFNKTYTASLAIVAFLFLSSAFGFPWGNAPKNDISWSDNLRQAQELSRQTGKPVLVHFFSDTCPPCKMMEKNTFPNPEIAATVQNSFIPVKLNANQFPREAQMFNVQSVPMDIVLSSGNSFSLRGTGSKSLRSVPYDGSGKNETSTTRASSSCASNSTTADAK